MPADPANQLLFPGDLYAQPGKVQSTSTSPHKGTGAEEVPPSTPETMMEDEDVLPDLLLTERQLLEQLGLEQELDTLGRSLLAGMRRQYPVDTENDVRGIMTMLMSGVVDKILELIFSRWSTESDAPARRKGFALSKFTGIIGYTPRKNFHQIGVQDYILRFKDGIAGGFAYEGKLDAVINKLAATPVNPAQSTSKGFKSSQSGPAGPTSETRSVQGSRRQGICGLLGLVWAANGGRQSGSAAGEQTVPIRRAARGPSGIGL
ncbi:BQ5605_C001g00706 [Microbotryum silenes-dioicae]|uniref:BQ5605_C001g00706 protein n=1 Tax=Microbotryum silenes-dioicae TaxID=796604 RepID=A0A2X0P6Q5_9BASI|nr:BQ5605_C001g00706 [Microbotryum silenes-dioicae]